MSLMSDLTRNALIGSAIATNFLCPAPIVSAADPVHPAPAIHGTETQAQRDARMAWWREAKFGMFIHWGLYALYGEEGRNGVGEWTMHSHKIAVSEYTTAAAEFNPVRFDADTWVSIAKAAGMKYLVITAKHHDGFAMYHTAVDHYNIYDATPFKRDPIAELEAACNKSGIKFGIYYSQNIDWAHPGGHLEGSAWDPAQAGDFDTYLKNVAAPQVAELVERYHPAVFWWDFPGDLTREQADRLLAPFPHPPAVIQNCRMGRGYTGDTDNYEQFIPSAGRPGRDWESCMTLNNHWGFQAADKDYKSDATLVRNLIDAVSKGGNYLLNVGPDGGGLIRPPEVDLLEKVGHWLERNGESVYGTTASPLKHLPANERVTVKGETLYLHVFDWNRGSAILPGLVTEIESATTLAGRESLTISRTSEGYSTIAAPTSPDPLVTVVVLKLKGALAVETVSTKIFADATGKLTATASEADLSGSLKVIERDSTVIVNWTDPAKDQAAWKLIVPASGGDYRVKLTYFCPHGGSAFDLVASPTSKVSFEVVETGGKTLKTFDLPGTLHLDPGVQSLRVVATALVEPLPNDPVQLALQDIVLTPIGGK